MTAKSTSTGRWRQVLVRVGIGLLAMAGVAGVGFWQGYQYGAGSVSPPAPVVDVLVAAATDVPTPAVAMEELVAPDVVGLPVERAREALLDAGIDLAIVAQRDAPQVGPPGVVVAQEPLGGAEVEGQVNLEVSVPAQVPDVVGAPEPEARSQLAELGARVVRVPVYEPGAELGNVLAVEPSPGQDLVEEVTMRVAVAGDGLFLADVDPMSRDCQVGDGVVSGRTFPRSLVCSVRRQGDDAVQVYTLDGRLDLLRVTVGLHDEDSDPRGRVRFEIRSEDGVLAAATVGYDETAELTAALNGIVRLELAAVSLAPDEADWDRVYPVWMDPQVEGAPDAVARLRE